MTSQQDKQTNVVILGGGYAGVLAAIRLAGKVRKTNTQITLVNGSAHFVERIRLHQAATNQALKVRPIAPLLPKANTRLCTGWVTRIEPKEQRVHMQTANGADAIAYDYLIYALGSATDMQSVPGVATFAHDVGSATSSGKLQQALVAMQAEQRTTPCRVLVVGGGMTGIESATELAERYPNVEVTLATQGIFGDNMSLKGSQYLRRIFGELQIELVEGAQIAEVTANHARCVDGRALPFDLCIWAGSFRAPALAKESGLRTDGQGRILVDETLRSVSHANIYAIGDAAATPLRMGCVTAMPMGAYAADHLAATITRNASIPEFQFRFFIRCISLGRGRGLVQFVDGDDAPQERIITGKAAARIKELICRFTVWSLQWEQLFPGSYMWPQKQLTQRAELAATQFLVQ